VYIIIYQAVIGSHFENTWSYSSLNALSYNQTKLLKKKRAQTSRVFLTDSFKEPAHKSQ